MALLKPETRVSGTRSVTIRLGLLKNSKSIRSIDHCCGLARSSYSWAGQSRNARCGPLVPSRSWWGHIVEFWVEIRGRQCFIMVQAADSCCPIVINSMERLSTAATASTYSINGTLHSEQNKFQKRQFLFLHSGPENLKKSRPKKPVKSNKSISRKKIGQIPFFANWKMAENQCLNWEKF